MPSGDVSSVRWSFNGTYLAVGLRSSPYIYIYKRSGDTFTKLANPASLPGNEARSIDFSSDDTYLATGEKAGGITIYKRAGDTFTKLAGQPDFPTTDTTRGITISNNTTYLVAGEDASPYIRIYKRSGDTFTQLAGQPDVLPGALAHKADFSYDDNYLAITSQASPYVLIYKRAGDTFTKVANPAVLPYADGKALRFNNLGGGGAPAAPTITSVTPPSNGDYITGQQLDFTVNWSENMDVTGVPRIALTFNTGTVYALYTSGTGTSAHTYRYTVQGGDYDNNGIVNSSPVDLNGGTIKSSASSTNGTLTFSPPDTSGITINTAAPTITSVTPPPDNTYIVGENLEFTVNWSENMTVNTGGGTPRIQLTIGATTRYADYVSGSGTSAHLYRYTVVTGDEDTNGIASVSPLDANGGTIRNGVGTDGILTFTPPNTTNVLVDGVAPSITSISPPANATYNFNDNMDFVVNWDENVSISGTPRLQINIGGTTKYANYLSGTGTNAITFRYTVECGLTDANGVDDVSPLGLNGGTITDVPGNNADLTFSASNYASVLVDATDSNDLVLSIAHSGSPYVSLYKNGCGVFSKLSDVTGGLPSGEGVDVDIDYDNQQVSVRHKVSPRLRTYKWNGTSYAKLTDPGTKPSSDSADQSIDIMHDGTYYASSNGNSSIIYDSAFSANTLTSETSCLSTSTEWGHDGTYLAVSKDCSPYLDIYRFTDFSAPTFNKLSDPASLPPGIVQGMSFSSDSVYLATGHDSSPYITIYKRSGDTFTKLSNPASLPAGNVNEVAFSEDDTYLAVGSDSNPNLIIYKRSGDTFTKLSGQPDTDPTSAVTDVGFSYDGQYLAATTSSSPYVYIYQRSGDTFTKIADPATLPAGSANGLKFRSYKTTVSRPSDGDYSTGQNLDFYANFPEDATVAGGTPRISLTIGSSTKYATYVSGSGSSRLLFRYTVASGDSDTDGIVVNPPLQLNSSTITLAGGSAADLSFTAPVTDAITINNGGGGGSPATYVYAGSRDDSLRKIDASDKSEVWNQNMGADVYGVAIDSSDNLYITVSSSVKKLNSTATSTIWTYTGHTDTIYAVKVDSSGNTYTASRDQTARKINSSGNLVWSYTGHSDRINDVAIDSSGNLYSAGDDNELHKIDSSGNNVWIYSGSDSFKSVAVDSSGNVYGGTSGASDVVKLDSSGNLVWTYTAPANWVKSVGVDSSGNVYAGDKDGNVHKINSSGNQVWVTATGGSILDLEVDGAGNVFVGTDGSNDVVKIDTNGNTIWTFTSFSSQINGIAIK